MSALPNKERSLKKTLIKGVIFFVLLVVLVGTLWTWAALTYVYSKGDRSGFVQKFSKRGWVIKTWEGELAMVNLPGAMPEVFYFSVRDEAAVKKIKDHMGKRSVLSYEEHRGLPGRFFGDTSYFVVDSRPVEGDVVP